MFAIFSLVTLGLCARAGMPSVQEPAAQNPAAAPVAAEAAQPPILVRAEKLYVRPGRVIDRGAVLIERGVIVAVGRDLQAPEGARVIEGKVACPGFVDAWSSFALDSAAQVDSRINPATLATDAVDPYVDTRLEQALLRAGVTTYRLQPIESSRSSGTGAVIRLHPSKRADQTVVLADCCIEFGLGISRDGRAMDVFERVSDVDRISGAIAEGRAYLEDKNEYRHDLEEWQKKIAEKEKELDENFKKAKKDREKAQADAKEKGGEFKEKEYKEDKKPKPPRYDEEKEAMARVAAGEVPLVVEVHRALEIRNLLEATKRFDRLRLILAGATEAGEFATELVERKIPVIVWPQPLGEARAPEFEESDLGLAAELEEKGVEVILGSGGAGGLASRELPLLAAIAVGHGLPPQAALAALTTRPARAFDVADKVGVLEMGREADVVVLDGEPFEAATKVRFVVSGGEVVVGGS